MKRVFLLLSTTALMTLTTPGSASKFPTKNNTPTNPTTPVDPTAPATTHPKFMR